MATKAKIAELAGVSPATVSNFYNGKDKMAEETKRKILEAARKLGYPEPEPRCINNAKKTTLLVADDLQNPHYGSILNGMTKVAVQNSICVSMCKLWDDVDKFCEMIISEGFYAVYFVSASKSVTQRHIDYLSDNGVRVFFSWNNFNIDFDMLLDKAIKYFIDLGHSRIAYLSGLSIDDDQNVRYKSYLKALEANNLPVDPELIIDGIYPYNTDSKSGYWATVSFLKKNVDFTAIIALNDLLAIGSMNALAENGLNVPADVSVLGCDDIVMSEYVNPPLSTMRYSTSDIGSRTMYSIIHPEENYGSVPVTLQTELVIRKSTGKAPEK